MDMASTDDEGELVICCSACDGIDWDDDGACLECGHVEDDPECYCEYCQDSDEDDDWDDEDDDA